MATSPTVPDTAPTSAQHADAPSAPRPTLLSLFSGGGLADLGYRAAGFEPVGAVEYDEAIAAVYAANLGAHVQVADVCSVDYRPFAGVTLVHLSPVCTRASVANSDATESEEDLRMADACCRCLRETRPDFVTLENVQGYAKFESFRRIVTQLRELGYQVAWSVLNSANFGVAQTRRRLILRASRVGRVPALPQTHCEGGETGGLFGDEHGLRPWVGWYAAVEDLLPTLPESRFADWQLKRLPEWLDTCLVGGANTSDEQAAPGVGDPHAGQPTRCVNANNSDQWRAFLLSDAKTEYSDGRRNANEPALSVTSQHGGRLRAFLVHGTSTGDVRDGSAPSAAVMATVGAKAAMPKALLINGQNASRELTLRDAEAPSFGVTSANKGTPRAWLEQGRVVAMNPRALMRFQSVPDSYVLPDKNSLATRIIGNGVPSLLCQRIGEAWLNGGAL